jgi:hypothetical protein
LLARGVIFVTLVIYVMGGTGFEGEWVTVLVTQLFLRFGEEVNGGP